MPEPTPPADTHHVFVYGTLRRGDVRDITRMHPAPQFVGMASVAGTLYDLGSYPGVVLGGPGRVTGEVYAISAELESQLDVIEEVWPQQTGEYSKQQVRVQVRDSGTAVETLELDCLVYEINTARTAGKPVIASGDWHERRPPR
ncbi:gamma-glutamylcyclotransferase family protein [Polaromonas sp.]|uniref:gamma-glutamylcyclotransferase family protein n=1 Tax=Polaromonas sp. TaxID=1869339 RepID=UPI0032644679